VAGLLVTLEGIDRAGKSTQARLLLEALGGDALSLREPGGTDLGERIRALLRDPALEVCSEAEALLFAAARAELVRRVIRPALDADRIVVVDRFTDSSLAYQGEGRALGAEAITRLNRWATGGLSPDLTVLLEVEPSAAARRAGERDRFEDEGLALQTAVAAAYDALAEAEPERWRRVRADRPPEEVHADVLAAVRAARTAAPA
jgi:dTMP kinase